MFEALVTRSGIVRVHTLKRDNKGKFTIESNKVQTYRSIVEWHKALAEILARNGLDRFMRSTSGSKTHRNMNVLRA